MKYARKDISSKLYTRPASIKDRQYIPKQRAAK